MNRNETHNRAVQMRRQHTRQDVKSLWLSLAVFTTMLLSTNNSAAQNTQTTNTDSVKNNTVLIVSDPASTNVNEARSDTLEVTSDLVFSPDYHDETREACENYILNETSRQRVIEQISKQKTEELQKQIIQNIDSLQTEIKNAARRGQKTSFIAKIFKKVSPLSVSGRSNYCTAGAMSVYDDLTDPVLKEIAQNTLASAQATPEDLHLFSHPNISCPAFCSYYKENFGDNYIDRKSPQFKNALNNLEPGDVLIVKSSTNTSSGLHCVTFEKYEGENICVKGFNRESNYAVGKPRIVSITKIPSQFKENIRQVLENDQELLISLMEQNPSITSRALQMNLKRTAKMMNTNSLIEERGKQSVTSLSRMLQDLTKTM